MSSDPPAYHLSLRSVWHTTVYALCSYSPSRRRSHQRLRRLPLALSTKLSPGGFYQTGWASVCCLYSDCCLLSKSIRVLEWYAGRPCKFLCLPAWNGKSLFHVVSIWYEDIMRDSVSLFCVASLTRPGLYRGLTSYVSGFDRRLCCTISSGERFVAPPYKTSRVSATKSAVMLAIISGRDRHIQPSNLV